MFTIEQFSRMVAAVHAAAVEPDGWDDALSLVRASFGANAAGLVRGHGAQRVLQNCDFLDEAAMRAYRDYYRQSDYVLAAVERSAVGLAHSGGSLVALKPRSEFHVDWIRRYALDDGFFVRLAGPPRPYSFAVAGPRGAGLFAGPDTVKVLNAFIPQLQRALCTQHTVTGLRDRAEHHDHPADAFSAPAAVIAPDMTVAYVNPAAESLLRCGTDVLVTSGRMRLSAPAADTELRRAVACAARATGVRTGDSLRVPRSGSPHPLVVHVLPLPDNQDSSALVVVVDPDARPEPTKQLLRRVLSLTDSEAEVALRIGRGLGLSAIADELSLSLATVKTHLQHTYQKTDTHRQSDLVRLMLALMP
ncbi:helix-turn-helix transcriptional regulator [Mycobacterium sp. ITM-2016-00317]|uniref:helix-turn-helix transcriptional regulator n=1 Tax=Mycobacterium sp. ITM-2016-00317 TaxID=2099694 RepID=UPI00287FE1C3|nr:helix-turn-helix transcriptional regulator [Mycobacterium sp. ITM-2016-00317]WNG88292.1 helix-turn-helix transcriptional regulator [Mycobacterium sp. ITM-2016-00317]